MKAKLFKVGLTVELRVNSSSLRRIGLRIQAALIFLSCRDLNICASTKAGCRTLRDLSSEVNWTIRILLERHSGAAKQTPRASSEGRIYADTTRFIACRAEFSE